ncbi:alpha/beta fold hydrolase [Streptomyces sp. O3]
MPTFTAYDGTLLACRLSGDGPPLVCLPGGPLQDSGYLGELGGLGAHRRLIRLDLRGSGRSATPDDPATYRCDRLVDDVEALREHLELDRMDLLAHSAGTNLAARYVERHPARVGKLALITPSAAGVGITVDADIRLRTAGLRRDEPWFPAAFAALAARVGGQPTKENFRAVAPFWYGRWDAAARAHRAAADEQRDHDAAVAFAAEGAFDPDATRAALASFGRPVLLLAGEFDVNSPPSAVAELAGMFPRAELAVQPRAGHFPWLDDPGLFTATVATYLSGA